MLVTQGSGAAGEQTRWRITALDTGTSHLDQSMLTYTVGVGQVVRIPRVMWLVEGPTTVVVDTSVQNIRAARMMVGSSCGELFL